MNVDISMVKDSRNCIHMPKLIYLTESGSTIKGYATALSDSDLFGIFVCAPEDYLVTNTPKERFSTKLLVNGVWCDAQLWDFRTVANRIGTDVTIYNAFRSESTNKALIDSIPYAVLNDIYKIPLDIVSLIYSCINWNHKGDSHKSVMQHAHASLTAINMVVQPTASNDIYYHVPMDLLALTRVTPGITPRFRNLVYEMLQAGVKSTDDQRSELRLHLAVLDHYTKACVKQLNHTVTTIEDRNRLFRRTLERVWKFNYDI